MKTLLLSICLLSVFSSFASDIKIDWTLCKKEISESCIKVKDDHEIHECIEKLPKNKISKVCSEMNSKLEGKFSDKHDKGHAH